MIVENGARCKLIQIYIVARSIILDNNIAEEMTFEKIIKCNDKLSIYNPRSPIGAAQAGFACVAANSIRQVLENP